MKGDALINIYGTYCFIIKKYYRKKYFENPIINNLLKLTYTKGNTISPIYYVRPRTAGSFGSMKHSGIYNNRWLELFLNNLE